MGKAREPCLGPGLVIRRMVMPASQVVFLKGIVEARDGIAQVFAERGGDLLLAGPANRRAEFDRMIDELADELGAIVDPSSTVL